MDGKTLVFLLHQAHRAVVQQPTAQGPQLAGTFGPQGPQDGRQQGPPLQAGAQPPPQQPPLPQQPSRKPPPGTQEYIYFGWGQLPLRNGRKSNGPGGQGPT